MTCLAPDARSFFGRRVGGALFGRVTTGLRDYKTGACFPVLSIAF